MTPRERRAWIWLVTLTLTWGAYFITFAMIGDRLDLFGRLKLFGAVTLLQLAVLGSTALYYRRRNREDGVDERDRAIESRSQAAAYHVLMMGMIVVGCIMPFSHSGWDLVNASVFAIVLSEFVNQALTVRAYRRGWSA